MATTHHVDVTRSLANTPDFKERIEQFKGSRMNTLIGRGLSNLFREHFFRLNAERANRLGGKRTNFYSDAAKATSSRGTDQEALVTVAQQGIRQRLEGGTIFPGPGKKYLTIPARAEAYGRRAAEFNNLHFVKTARGGMLVAEDENWVSEPSKNRAVSKFAKAADGEGAVYYWLVPSVTQEADRSVLPDDHEIEYRVRQVIHDAWWAGKKGLN